MHDHIHAGSGRPAAAARRLAPCAALLLSLLLWTPSRAAETHAGADRTKAAPSPATEVRKLWLDEDATFPRRLAVAPYVDGQPDGEARFYVASGALCMIDHYKAGVLDGERIEYYPGGRVFRRYLFVDGKVEGPSLQWYPDGTLFSTLAYRGGVQDGEFVQFYRNGRPAVQSTLVNGLPQGQRRHYLSDGRLLGLTNWVDGREVGRQQFLEPSAAQTAETADLVNWAKLQLRDLWEDGDHPSE